MGEHRRFALPDIGEGLIDAELLRWFVEPGDVVEVNQPLAEIETAKAVVELPSPYGGTVVELLVPAQTTVDVGTEILSIAVDGEAGPDVRRADETMLVGYGSGTAAAARPPAAPGRVPRTGTATGRVAATPPVRKLARELGVNLAEVTGSGPGGAVTRDDLRRATAGPPGREPGHEPGHEAGRDAGREAGPAAARKTAPENGRVERLPVKGVRRHTAEAMVRSAFTAPHVTTWVQADVTASMDALRRLRALPEFAGVKATPLLLAARALVVAAGRHPMINAAWDEAALEIVVARQVNLGIAVATERGLIVPNVKDAGALSLRDLATALAETAGTARAGGCTPRDLTGGTITITNAGVFGVDGATPILPPGEAAILALGQVRRMPWVRGDAIEVREVTTLALSFDHRLVDGELGSAVLRDVADMLEDPLRLLAWA